MDASGLVRLIWAANKLSGRGDVGPELMGASVRSAAVRVGGALTRRLMSAIMGDGGRSFDLRGLSDLVRDLDGLIVDGDGLSKPLTTADIALVWTLRNEITQCMAAYPDGAAMAAGVDRSPTAQAARSIAEPATAQLPPMPGFSEPAHPDAMAGTMAVEEGAVPRTSVSPVAVIDVGAAEEQAPVADKAAPASFGLFSRALMHLHNAIGGNAAPDTVEGAVPVKPNRASNPVGVP